MKSRLDSKEPFASPAHEVFAGPREVVIMRFFVGPTSLTLQKALGALTMLAIFSWSSSTFAQTATLSQHDVQASSDSKSTDQNWALTPYLGRAYAKLKTMRTAPIRRQGDSMLKLPDRMKLRRMLRAGDISELKRNLPDIHRRYALGELSEDTFYQALEPLDAVLPEALPALDEWVNQSPREYVAYLARAIVRARLGWDARGSELIRYVLKKDVDDMRRWHTLAAQDYLASLDLSTRSIPSIAGLIALAQARGKFDEGRRLYAEGMRISPGSSALFTAFKPLLEFEWGGHSLAEAEAALASAQKAGVDAEAWSTLKRGIDNAHSGNRFGRDARAAREYLIQFSEKYQTMDGWLTRAVEERKLGLYEDAERSLNRASEIRPQSRRLLEERAFLDEKRGLLADAVTNYRRASALGSNYAQEKLIFAYSRGALGLKIDLAAARQLCEESAAAYNAAGEFCLGWFYSEGLAGLQRDPKQASMWERRAAHHGNAAAANNIGWRLLQGDGIPADRNEAIYFLRKSARGGQQSAISKLQELGVPLEEPGAKNRSIDAADRLNRT